MMMETSQVKQASLKGLMYWGMGTQLLWQPLTPTLLFWWRRLMVTTSTLHPHHLVFHLLHLCLSTAPFFYSYASWLPVIRIHIGKTAAKCGLVFVWMLDLSPFCYSLSLPPTYVLQHLHQLVVLVLSGQDSVLSEFSLFIFAAFWVQEFPCDSFQKAFWVFSDASNLSSVRQGLRLSFCMMGSAQVPIWLADKEANYLQGNRAVVCICWGF